MRNEHSGRELDINQSTNEMNLKLDEKCELIEQLQT